MLAHLNDIRNSIVIGADAVMDSEVVTMVCVAFYSSWWVNTLCTINNETYCHSTSEQIVQEVHPYQVYTKPLPLLLLLQQLPCPNVRTADISAGVLRRIQCFEV
jgi:hypothetical protein